MSGQAVLQEIADSIDHANLPSPCARLRDFITSIPEEKRASDRRRADRYRVVADVIVVPLDDDFRPAARAFVACSRNVSAGGMCLFHKERVESSVVYVEMNCPEAPRLSAVMKILRQTRFGEYFEIAGEFLPECPFPRR